MAIAVRNGDNPGMDRPRIIRWLCISVSASCLVMCALLLGLWLRSYHLSSSLKIPPTTTRGISIFSFQGRIRFDIVTTASKPSDYVATGKSAFYIGGTVDNIVVKSPHWFLVLVLAILAALFFMGWRSSFRTMLNAMTAVASMYRTRNFKWLRVSMSAMCLTFCCLLILLWIRSYNHVDIIAAKLTSARRIQELQAKGRIRVTVSNMSLVSNWWTVRYSSIRGLDVFTKGRGFHAAATSTTLSVGVPHWFPVLLFAVMAVVPWLPLSTRFSLRTLLMVTTVIAVLLGMMVWWVRR